MKVNGYRAAGAQVSESEMETRRCVCLCGRDAPPCGLLFLLSLPPSPPCAQLCVVFVLPSPLPWLSHPDSRVHYPLPEEGLESRLCPSLVYSEKFPFPS